MKRPELFLAAIVAGFVAFIVHAARDVRRDARSDAEPAATLALARTEDAPRGAAKDSAAMTAPRDTALVRRMLELGAEGTYIGAILDAQDSVVIRWPDRTFEPLTVWIQPESTVPDFPAGAPELVREGFEAWVEPSAPVRFTFVVDSARAAVVVTWVDRFAGDSRIGVTRRTHGSDGLIVDADIELAVHDSSGATIPPQIVRAAAMHEVGHLLGLNHSPQASDIMHESASLETRDLSGADRRTLQLLYHLPPGPTR